MLFKRRRRKKEISKRTPKQVLVLQILVGFSIAICIGLLGTGVWYGSRVATLTITDVEVLGGETIAHEEVLRLAYEELEGAYYKLVPRRFAWTYPEQKITERISGLERMKNVHVERTSGTSITIAFEEYRPFALWCEHLDSKECLFLDRDGFSFAAAPKLQGSAFVRFSYTDTIPELATFAFDGEFIKTTEEFITRAYDQLALNIIQVEKTAKDELVYHISGGGQLKVTQRMTTDETLDNLATILSSKEFEHIEPGNFQYIDLRYGNKIFVNEEEPSLETASTTASSTS
ncbi:MAG: cell division septal protein FtsQ [Candidatus Azotimanducaceae bacterium]|jgi:cell division septal protein FtsQ